MRREEAGAQLTGQDEQPQASNMEVNNMLNIFSQETLAKALDETFHDVVKLALLTPGNKAQQVWQAVSALQEARDHM